MTDKPISPLRQRKIDDMTARRIKEKVQKDYVRHVRTFAAFLGRSPDTATSEDLRRFQVHSGAAADRRCDHQRRHRRAAVLFQRDARTARPRPSSDDRDETAQVPCRLEPGGGGRASSKPRPASSTRPRSASPTALACGCLRSWR